MEVAGDESCAVIGEVDGERTYRAALLDADRAVRHRRHRRGVEPAGEQAAQRHVADDLRACRLRELRGQSPDHIV